MSKYRLESKHRHHIELDIDRCNLSSGDRKVVLNWVYKTCMGSDEVADGLLLSWLQGRAELAKVRDGEPAFRITDMGREHIDQLLKGAP